MMNFRRYFVEASTITLYKEEQQTFYMPVLVKNNGTNYVNVHQAISDERMPSIYGFETAEEAFAIFTELQEKEAHETEDDHDHFTASHCDQEDFHADG